MRRLDSSRARGGRGSPEVPSRAGRDLHHRPQHQPHEFLHRVLQFLRLLPPDGDAEGYILSKETIGEKIQETIDLGGTGVLMQGGVNPDLKIEYFEDLFSWIKKNYAIHLHCLSAPEILTIAEVSNLSIRDTIARMRDAGLDSIPGAGAEILDDEVRVRIARLKCNSAEWVDVHRTAHELGMRTTATMMFGCGGDLRAPRQPP